VHGGHERAGRRARREARADEHPDADDNDERPRDGRSDAKRARSPFARVARFASVTISHEVTLPLPPVGGDGELGCYITFHSVAETQAALARNADPIGRVYCAGPVGQNNVVTLDAANLGTAFFAF
jgi:hypothetical protein